MKKLNAFLLTFLISSAFFAQQVNQVAKNQVKTTLDRCTYVVLGQQKEVRINAGESLFLDLPLSLLEASPVANMEVVIADKTWQFEGAQALTLKKLEGQSKIDVRLHYTNGSKTAFSLGLSHAHPEPYLASDTVVFGLLAVVLALIFYTSHLSTPFWKKVYTVLPALLLCYLIPAMMNSFGLISEHSSSIYTIAKDYLLPAALVLMTLGIDFKGLVNLGPKALIMFLTGTLGIVIGGPLAILLFKYIDPSVVGGEGYDATWRGFATLAGSWIGGGANQAAMLETYKYTQALYGKMVTVDIVVANIWMAFLLWAAARHQRFDKWLKADASSIESLKEKMITYQQANSRVASVTDYMIILGCAFGAVSISHFFGNDLAKWFEGTLGGDSPFASSFFWLVVIATTIGLLMSLTKLRSYEGAGASKLGSVFIYILVVSIGMKMGLKQALEEPMLILVGIVWMLIHAGIMFLVAKLIKAPFFFIAVGSKANVGGAASAPVVASAFHPSLASVGALLAVLGYALGTYGAILSAEMMRFVAP